MFGMGDDRSERERAEERPRGAGFLAKLLGRPTDRRSGGSEGRPARAEPHHDRVATAQDAITEAPGDTPGTDVLVRQFIAQNIVAAKRAPNEYREVDGHVAAIVKAARNRGLEVIRAGDGRYFYLHGVPVGGVRRMVTTMVGHIALTSCASKHVTRHLLTAAGVPIPRGADFAADELMAASEHVRTLGRPVAIKPSQGSGGGGVSVGVVTPGDVEAAWAVAVDATGRRDRIVVEEQISGLDVRAFVIGERVVAASARVPAYVVGDGRSSLSDLIKQKQAKRQANIYLSRGEIVVDEQHLRGQGRTPESVPQHSEVVVVNRVANIHQGGENIDVTEEISPGVKDLAVRAARAIPGLHVAGVDLMVPALDQHNGAVVLEANTSANIAMHHAPAYGEPVDVAADIVDEMLAKRGT